MDFKLHGKRALVTGSTQGIGFAIAQGLAREGAAVVVNGGTKPRRAPPPRRSAPRPRRR
jgi:NAD(P)-dependent dehydrogenase (short-subunit alcohol dehydrogenase family)